jgi:hypothetical protein
MSDTNNSFEVIIRECVTALGYDKALQIVTSMKQTTTEEKPKVEEKPKDEKKSTKRIPRMSPNISKDLVTELGKVGLTYDEKQLKKVKEEFVAYVDSLTQDEYVNHNMTHHMVEFSKKKKGPTVEVKTEEKVVQVKTEEKPKKAKATAATSSVKKEEETSTDEAPAFSNAANVEDVDLKELQSIKMIATPGGVFKGVYWDADDKGRWVRGPDADKDEDLIEIGFKKETFMVGEKSGRVYKETEKGDVLQGFVGVGQFSEMKMPSMK